jgi:hypothetical protein
MTAQNQLIDILAHVPGLLQDHKELQANGTELSRQALESKIRDQLLTASAWRSQWEKSNLPATDEPSREPQYPLLGLIPTHPFSKVFVCSSWRQATEICLYNAVVVPLLKILWALETAAEKPMTSLQSCPAPSLLPDQIAALEQTASGICSTIEAQLATTSQSCRFSLHDPPSPLSKGIDLESSDINFQPNVILRGIWLRLWPAFPLI